MEEIVANISKCDFKIEAILNRQTGLGATLFDGMDKSSSEKCKYYLKGSCSMGNQCPFRHSRGDKSVVCKHWLRGLCKKSDMCEFLHEFDMTKMPECYFFQKFGECSNGDDCMYLHIDPESKIKECPWYARGFCRHGNTCRHKHTRKVICQNYLCGFCPEGPNCTRAHPKWELPRVDWMDEEDEKEKGGGGGNNYRDRDRDRDRNRNVDRFGQQRPPNRGGGDRFQRRENQGGYDRRQQHGGGGGWNG